MWIRITCFFCMSTMNFQKNNYIYIFSLYIFLCIWKVSSFSIAALFGSPPFLPWLAGMSGSCRSCSETGWIVISHLARDLGLSFLFVHPSTFLSCFFFSWVLFFCFLFLVFGTENRRTTTKDRTPSHQFAVANWRIRTQWRRKVSNLESNVLMISFLSFNHQVKISLVFF